MNSIASSHPVAAIPHPEELDQVRERIASALNSSPRSIAVDHCRSSRSRLTLHCWGSSAGRRFFGKIFVSDPYPIQRASLLGLESLAPPSQVRSVEDQIDFEWEMTNKLREVGGSDRVPAPLGKCPVTKTIVWEQVSGRRLEQLIKQTGWRDPRGYRSTAALFQAGAWLSKVHDLLPLRLATMDFHTLMDGIPDLVQKEGWPQCAGIARKVLEETVASLHGTRELSVPVGLVHGDFNLENLIWNAKTRQLFIVDFERCGQGAISYDLVSIIFCLRVKLLNPFIPKGVIELWEKSFWAGYGSIPGELRACIDAQATLLSFGSFLLGLSTRKNQHGWLAASTSTVYKAFLENHLLRRRFGVDDL